MKNSIKISFSAIMTAVCCVIMTIGSFFGNIDLTAAAIASLCVVLTVIEIGYKHAILVYVASSVLGALIIPVKTPVLFFTLFLGFYPILKSFTERLKKPQAIILKLSSYFISVTAIILLYLAFFAPETTFPKHYYILIAIFGALVFVVYDYALTKLISVYIFNIRKRIKADKLFGKNK